MFKTEDGARERRRRVPGVAVSELSTQNLALPFQISDDGHAHHAAALTTYLPGGICPGLLA